MIKASPFIVVYINRLEPFHNTTPKDNLQNKYSPHLKLVRTKVYNTWLNSFAERFRPQHNGGATKVRIVPLSA
jgi:hypothetical protein